MRSPAWVLVGDRLRPAATVRVAPWSPAVRRGAGLLETVGCDRGRAFLLAEHLERMRAGAGALGWRLPELPADRGVERLLGRERLPGPAALRVLALDDGPRLRVIAWAERVTVAARLRRDGSRLHPVVMPSGPLAGVKSSSYLPQRWAAAVAVGAGADAALLIDGDGAVRETDHANVFAVIGAEVLTPPSPERCLPGVMRSWTDARARRSRRGGRRAGRHDGGAARQRRCLAHVLARGDRPGAHDSRNADAASRGGAPGARRRRHPGTGLRSQRRRPRTGS